MREAFCVDIYEKSRALFILVCGCCIMDDVSFFCGLVGMT